MAMRRPHPLSTSLSLERLHEEARYPSQESDRHSQFLLYSCLPDSPVGVPPKESRVIDTGLKVEQPSGYQLYLQALSPELFVQPVLQEGRLLVSVFNAGNTTVCFNHGDPVALLSVLASVSTSLLIEEEESHD